MLLSSKYIPTELLLHHHLKYLKMVLQNKVLLIGVDTTKLSGTRVTEFDSASIRFEAEESLKSLINEGYDAKWHFLDLSSDTLEALQLDLSNNNYDCVMVGAGIRRRPETLFLFETIVNMIHFSSPDTKICFNADVHDTIQAIKRTLKFSKYESNTI